MHLLNQDILYINSGVIVTVVDCRARLQPSTTSRIWQKYPIAYEKYNKHVTFLNWQPGKIQPIKVSNTLWICNFAGKRCHKLDPEVLNEAFIKLRDWSSERRLKVHIPFESDLDQSEWLHYIQALNNFCPNAVLCFSDSRINEFLFILKQTNFSLKELTDLICQKASSLKIFRIKIPPVSSGAFALGHYNFGVGSGIGGGGYTGESSYIELISFNDLTKIINDLFKIVDFLQIGREVSNANSQLLAQYRNLLSETLQSIPKQHRLRKSDGSEHIGIALYDVFDSLQSLRDYEQQNQCN